MSAASPPSPASAPSADSPSSGLGRAIDLTAKLATSWVGLATAYAGAVTAAVIAFKKLEEPLHDWPLWGRVALVSALPLVSNLEPLRHLGNLSYLNISHTPVRNLEPLAESGNLSTLDLVNTPVRNLEPLKRLPRLSVLYIDPGPARKRAIEDLQAANRELTINPIPSRLATRVPP